MFKVITAQLGKDAAFSVRKEIEAAAKLGQTNAMDGTD